MLRSFVALPVFLVASGCASPTPSSKERPRSRLQGPKFDQTPLTAKSESKAATAARSLAAPPAPPDVGAPPPGAEKSASGLAWRVVTKGTGTSKPREWDQVEVHYTGWTADGKMFGSSVTRGKPAKFTLFQVIPGWSEGVQLMVEGEKRRFWVPSKIAYDGKLGAPQGDLTFDIELLAINKKIDPPAPPKDLAKAPSAAKRTKSGVSYKMLERGRGKKPADGDTVEIEYTGWLGATGKLFDSTHINAAANKMALKRLVPGWREVMLQLREGDHAIVWIPEKQAYGGRPGAPRGDLVLDLKLLSVVEAPKPPPVPKNLAKPPADVERTDSGIAYKVLKKGTGNVHPAASSRVKVHYSGWTTDGKMFDSSVTRGQPSKVGLGQVIKGWTEGVALMVVGEKTRFWIPESLAYQGRPGKPAGMLVFDIELMEIDG